MSSKGSKSSLKASSVKLSKSTKASKADLADPVPASQPSASNLRSKPSLKSISEGNATDKPGELIAYYMQTLEGIMPLFLTGMTQDLFKIKPGDDLSPEKLYRVIPKADFLSDIQARLAISDFYPAKQDIIDYPGEELIVHHDPDFKYGQNFFLVLKPETMEFILNPVKPEEEGQAEATLKQRPKQWVSLGSEAEIDMESIKENRDLVTVKMSRRFSEFKGFSKFADRDAHDAFYEFRPFRDPAFELYKVELPISVQAVPETVEKSIQTTWNRPQNFSVQYEPLLLDQQQKSQHLTSADMNEFIHTVSIRLEAALQQNEISNIFRDDYAALGDEEVTFDKSSKSTLSVFQSFTDLKNSKDRCISCIDWHPTQKGIVAMSCVSRASFEEKVEYALNRPSFIIIWSFQDSIHPQLILEAPEDINVFKFNPSQPHLIAAGCANGQIVMWDITKYMEKIKATKKGDDSEEKETAAPVVRHDISSSIEYSHKAGITHLQWLNPEFELGPNGEPNQGTHGDKQLITSSLDGNMAFWDIRQKEDLQSLDLKWKPFFKIPLTSTDNSFEYSLTKVSIYQKFSEKKDKNTKNWSSKFFASTEEGDLLYADWISEKAGDEKTSRVEFSSNAHCGSLSDLQRSPFFPDILLSVGSWSFNIWKEKQTGSLLTCSPRQKYMICGQWSPTRPSVFFIGRSDGVVEIWDLLDHSDSPLTVQTITSCAISYMCIHTITNAGKSQYYLAIGDDAGTLHILEIPKSLSKPIKNEQILMEALLDRETKRLNFTKSRRQVNPEQVEEKKVEPKAEDDFEKDYQKMETAFLEATGMIAPAAL